MIRKRDSIHIIWINYLLIVILNLGLINHLISQEKLVHFFPDQNILSITRSYADKMYFFEDYENFVEAKLFVNEEKNFVIEVYYLKNDSTYKDRMILTPEEKTTYLQQMLDNYAAKSVMTVKNDSGQVVALNQQGRPALLVMNTITGLGFYGYALPMMLDIEDGKAFVGLYMLAASTSFYLPYRSTSFKNVTKAQASLSFYGQSRGIMQGLFLSELLTKDINYNYTNYYQYEREVAVKRQTQFALGIGASIAGGLIGNRVAAKNGYNGGDVSILQMWGDAGTISGIMLSDVLGFYNRSNQDAIYATAMATSAIGLFVGKKFADTQQYTLGDAIVYRSTLLLGCLAPATLVHYFEPKEESVYTSAMLIGGLGAGFFGWKLLQSREFDTGEGVFTALGEISGALLGLGAGYLIAPEDNNGKLILTTTTVGAAAGYFLMINRKNKGSQKTATQYNLDMSLNPMALMQKNRTTMNDSPLNANYLATIRLTF